MEFTKEQIKSSGLFETIIDWYGSEEDAIYGDFFQPALTEDEIIKGIHCYVNIWLPQFDKKEYAILPKDLSYRESVQREQIRDMLYLLRGNGQTEYFNSDSQTVKKFMNIVADEDRR